MSKHIIGGSLAAPMQAGSPYPRHQVGESGYRAKVKHRKSRMLRKFMILDPSDGPCQEQRVESDVPARSGDQSWNHGANLEVSAARISNNRRKCPSKVPKSRNTVQGLVRRLVDEKANLQRSTSDASEKTENLSDSERDAAIRRYGWSKVIMHLGESFEASPSTYLGRTRA
jgi:hypothetical protein